MDALQNAHDFAVLTAHDTEPVAATGAHVAFVQGMVCDALHCCVSIACDVATPVVAVIIRIGSLPLFAHGSSLIAFWLVALAVAQAIQ